MSLIDPRTIQINDYNYDLPDEKIAKYPLERRDQSKLLVYKDNEIKDENFSSIHDYLPSDSLMVYNNTKVIQARLHFSKSTGAQVEIFCLDPHHPHDYTQILQSTKKCSWNCLIGNSKKWKDGFLTTEIKIQDDIVILRANKINSKGSIHIVEFDWDNSNYTFVDLLEIVGELPIPPYLNRNTEEDDNERYQTLYSKVKGSVAAPTAGLHFTDNVLNKIKEKCIETEEVTLHVGAGTFKPVKSDLIVDHEMHSEFISVRRKTIQRLLSHTGNIIAVGTTSVRTLESLYYIGASLEKDPTLKDLKVSQWQPYILENTILSKEKALQNILNYLDKNSQETLLADTQILIAPGYTFKIVTGIITNFHQPQSTLLLLVSAFVKGNWKAIYNHALTHGYRFLSYGDSSLLLQ